jgi:hypothetical protein
MLLQAFKNLISRKYLLFEDILCILINLGGVEEDAGDGGGGGGGTSFTNKKQPNCGLASWHGRIFFFLR